jgi:hypothetical protein
LFVCFYLNKSFIKYNFHLSMKKFYYYKFFFNY